MRIVFMGSPEYAAIILAALAEKHDIVGVYTNADKVRGRGKALLPTPAKAKAVELGLPLFTPQTLRDEAIQEELRQLAPEVVCVAAYGKILPQEVLDIPVHGCLNVHASLLPRWRGAAPIQRAILAGDAEVGVCVMQMETGLDTGAYTHSVALPVGEYGAKDLTQKLAEAGAKALLETLEEVEAGKVIWTQQDEDLVTYAEKIQRGELHLSLDDTARHALAKVQASDEAHPAKCVISNRTVALLGARLSEASIAQGAAQLQGGKLLLGCVDWSLEILQVKPDGKGVMEAKAFAAGVQGIKQGVYWSALAEENHA